MMSSLELTDNVITQVHTLVRAIESLDTIQSSDPFERALADLFLAAYKRRLREIVQTAPPWVAEQVSSASPVAL
jgi:hypothetical protein